MQEPVAIMPTYLCHGFRWHRRAIRIFVILQDLEDATPDWVTGRKTSSIILSEFQETFKFLPEPPGNLELENPELSKVDPTGHQDDDFTLPRPRVPPDEDDVLANSWSMVKLLEEHDPDDMFTVCRPYAYVADYVVKVDLSVNIMDEMNKYETWAKQQDGWFTKLRDELQQDEQVQWYVVVCGDEPRDERGESDGEDILNDHDSETTEKGVASVSSQDSIRPELIERKPTPFDGLDFGFGRRSEPDHFIPSPGPPPPIPPPPIPTADPPRPRAHSQSLRASTSDKPSLDATDSNGGHEVKSPPASPPPKLRKRKSLAAGLRRMFGKKEEQPMPEQI